MIRPSAGSHRASAPIVPATAASAVPRTTASSSGPTRAEPAAIRARSAGARVLNAPTIAALSAAAPSGPERGRLELCLLGPASAEVPEPAQQERGKNDEYDVGHATAFLSSDRTLAVIWSRGRLDLLPPLGLVSFAPSARRAAR